MHDGVAHEAQNRPRARDIGVGAADHDEQLAGDGMALLAADGGVHHGDAALGHALGDRIGHRRGDGAHVHIERVLGKRRRETLRAEGGLLHMLGIRQHGDDDVDIAARRR